MFWTQFITTRPTHFTNLNEFCLLSGTNEKVYAFSWYHLSTSHWVDLAMKYCILVTFLYWLTFFIICYLCCKYAWFTCMFWEELSLVAIWSILNRLLGLIEYTLISERTMIFLFTLNNVTMRFYWITFSSKIFFSSIKLNCSLCWIQLWMIVKIMRVYKSVYFM